MKIFLNSLTRSTNSSIPIKTASNFTGSALAIVPFVAGRPPLQQKVENGVLIFREALPGFQLQLLTVTQTFPEMVASWELHKSSRYFDILVVIELVKIPDLRVPIAENEAFLLTHAELKENSKTIRSNCGPLF